MLELVMANKSEKIAVLGAGTMGAGIAQVALEAGWAVRIFDALPGATDRARARIADGLGRRAAKRQLAGSAARAFVDGALGRLESVPDLASVGVGAELVIEAAVEELEAKRAIFATLDASTPARTILATNTSALSVTAIAAGASRHPGRILGLHFFNPAPVLLLVEVVAADGTDPDVVDRATGIVTGWGKSAVRSSDSPGFIVNRERGEARVAEIDAAIRGDGFPMGPFELMDLVGLDINLAAATAVWEGLGRPERLRPSAIQSWLAADGRLGRKSGLGFYRYDAGHEQVPDPLPHEIAPPIQGGRSLQARKIVSRIRSAIAAEAVLARDEGVASEADIDTAIWLGAAHPEGPFAWARRHDPTIAT